MSIVRIILVVLLISLTGCNKVSESTVNSKENVSLQESGKQGPKAQHSNPQIPINNDSDSISQPVSLEGKFTPPSFLVKDFEAKATKDGIDFQLKYEIDDKLYEAIEKAPVYYFSIEFPESLTKETGLLHSDIVRGPNSQDGKLNYELIIKAKLKKALKAEIINKINTDSLSYNLLILDKDKYPIHIFNGVQLAESFSENPGSNIIIKDNN